MTKINCNQKVAVHIRESMLIDVKLKVETVTIKYHQISNPKMVRNEFKISQRMILNLTGLESARF